MLKELGLFITEINNSYVLSKTKEHLNDNKLEEFEEINEFVIETEDVEVRIRHESLYNRSCLYFESISNCPDDCGSCPEFDEEMEECRGVPQKLLVVLEISNKRTNEFINKKDLCRYSDLSLERIIEEINKELNNIGYTGIKWGCALL